MAFNRLFRQRRHARWDLAVDRNVRDADLLHRGNEGARFPSVAIEEPFPLQGGDVLHD